MADLVVHSTGGRGYATVSEAQVQRSAGSVSVALWSGSGGEYLDDDGGEFGGLCSGLGWAKGSGARDCWDVEWRSFSASGVWRVVLGGTGDV